MRHHLLRNSVFLRLNPLSSWVVRSSSTMRPASSQVSTGAVQSQSKPGVTTHTSIADRNANDSSNLSSGSSVPVHTPVDSHNPAQKTSGLDSAGRRRARPPLSYTDDFDTPESVAMRPIGVVRSPYKERFGTPRQPPVTENTLGNCQQPARIELYPHTRHELSLRGLSEFEYCWVLSFFHLNQGFNPLVTPPRGPRKKQGVFATRSPHRPNSIGLSCIRITSVDETKGFIHVLGVDLLDGTAVLDIKPYVPYCDAFPNARAGWLDHLNERMTAPDTLGYWPPPGHLQTKVQLPPETDCGVESPAHNCDGDPSGSNDKS